MRKDSTFLETVVRNWKLLTVITLLSWVLLFVGAFTDFSFNRYWVNVIFPLFVGFISVAALFSLLNLIKSDKLRTSTFLISIFTVLISGIYAGCPLSYGAAILLSNHSKPVLIQKIESPDGFRVLKVYHSPIIGAGLQGRFKVDLQIQHKFLPFVKRDLYWFDTYKPNKELKQIKWLDNDKLYIQEENKTLPVGIMKPKLSLVLELIGWGD